MDADSVEMYLDDNAERFDPSPNVVCAAGTEEFRARLELLAREQGFLKIGLAAADPFLEAGQRFKDWLGQGHAGTMSYLAEFGERHLPGRLLANARSIVVVAAALATPSGPDAHDRGTSLDATLGPDAHDRGTSLDATLGPDARDRGTSLDATLGPDARDRGTSLDASGDPRTLGPSDLRGNIANYALGLDYHIALRSRLRRIGQGLADLSGRSVWTRACIDTAPLLEREAARRAGIGFIGKSAMLIVPGVGPRVLLASMVTDLAPPWREEPLESRCGRCTACLDRCPTQAFVSPFRLDARRCLSYLSIEHQGEVPHRERDGFGDRLIGCDVCQAVCPYDRPESAPVVPADAAPRPHLVAPELVRWLAMSSSDYRRITKRTALRRLGRVQLMRNAAIALGNSRDRRATAALAHALANNSSPVVRAHAAWALGKLGGRAALLALSTAREHELESSVVAEIDAALGQPRST